MGALITTGYLGVVLKDYFITEELLERYEINTQNLNPEIRVGWELFFNVMRFYQITFYDCLIISYLLKHLKTLNADEKKKVDILKEQQIESGTLIQPIMEK